MYFLTGFPEQLRLPCGEGVLEIVPDSDGLLTAVLTPSSLYIWAFIRGQSALLGVLRRPRERLEEHGPNKAVLWRPHAGDSTDRQLALLVRLLLLTMLALLVYL
jgi:hypothetical protein